MSILENTWNGFSDDIAKKYLKNWGAPSLDSKRILAEILEGYAQQKGRLALIELGCGNGQLAEYFIERGLDFTYTGVDFSKPLLAAARQSFQGNPHVDFVEGNVQALDGVAGPFDFAIYSHVLEMVSSPEETLRAARRVARGIVIRFFEPPDSDYTTAELRDMEMGDGGDVSHPYIRWKLGRDFYRMMLAQLSVTRVDVYRSADKDQVHVLHFD